jgi:hypothetical protein
LIFGVTQLTLQHEWKINISENTYQLVQDVFECSHSGKISAKWIGEIDMYFVDKKK